MTNGSFIKTIKKKLTVSNLLNVLFAIAVLIIIFNPSAKAVLIQGLMKVGLFQPDVSQTIKTSEASDLPEIVFENNNGETINLSDQKGKVVFINFWATWCPPCIAETPSINDLQEKLRGNKNIVFIMVDTDHDFSRSAPFVKKHQFTFPVYQANTAIPANLLGSAIPTTVIFDRKGKMVFEHEGGADYSNPKVLAYLQQLSK
jgi:thiol-disulfide isomerase/thioredoxin